jgi:hypothetical protein
MSADLRLGDLVHVTADGCYLGLGLIVDVLDDPRPTCYKVLTSDGKNFFYFPFELAPVREGAV